jgi:hypothetical protein
VNLVVAASTQPVAATKIYRFFAWSLSKADVFVTKGGGGAMARTCREIAIEEMLRTVEEVMSRVTDWCGDLPPRDR